MSDDDFAMPPFKPDESLQQLRRLCRDLRGLTERGNGFEWKGHAVVKLALAEGRLQAEIARRPARSPEWETHVLASGSDVRRFGDELKRRVARWKDADD